MLARLLRRTIGALNTSSDTGVVESDNMRKGCGRLGICGIQGRMQAEGNRVGLKTALKAGRTLVSSDWKSSNPPSEGVSLWGGQITEAM